MITQHRQTLRLGAIVQFWNVESRHDRREVHVGVTALHHHGGRLARDSLIMSMPWLSSSTLKQSRSHERTKRTATAAVQTLDRKRVKSGTSGTRHAEQEAVWPPILTRPFRLDMNPVHPVNVGKMPLIADLDETKRHEGQW
jgi:hypothetical protein